jgi:DnaK suppressor protein
MVDALKLQAHIDADLSRAQLEELASLLADKRRELTERTVDLEQQIVIKDDCSLADAADAASLQESRLRARGMVDQHQHIINEIDAALRRLGNGSYGISEKTGEPIASDRLMLIPWARTAADDGE